MILLDSSFIVSFYNLRDENHSKAIELMENIRKGKYGSACTTDYIFDETITVALIRLKNLAKVVGMGEEIRSFFEIADVEKADFEEAWKFFKAQKETKFSFTDCTTIVVMRRKEINNIATFDGDFKKIEGINAIC